MTLIRLAPDVLLVGTSNDRLHGRESAKFKPYDSTFRQLVEEAGVRYLKALNRNWPNRIAEADDNAVCGVVVFHGHVV